MQYVHYTNSTPAQCNRRREPAQAAFRRPKWIWKPESDPETEPKVVPNLPQSCPRIAQSCPKVAQTVVHPALPPIVSNSPMIQRKSVGHHLNFVEKKRRKGNQLCWPPFHPWCKHSALGLYPRLLIRTPFRFRRGSGNLGLRIPGTLPIQRPVGG